MRTVHQKAQFVLWYVELKSGVAVQRKWRSLHPGEKPPTDKDLNRWMNQFNPFSTRGPIYRPPLCLRIMREADVSVHFFQAYSSRTLNRMLKVFTRLQRAPHLVP